MPYCPKEPISEVIDLAGLADCIQEPVVRLRLTLDCWYGHGIYQPGKVGISIQEIAKLGVRLLAGETVHEYIQVKTTEKDSKWNLNESTALDNKKVDNPLFQKSLKCDVRLGRACFRIVPKQDIAKVLEDFSKELDKRITPDDATAQGIKIAKRFPKTISAIGRDFSYWADNFVERARQFATLPELCKAQTTARRNR